MGACLGAALARPTRGDRTRRVLVVSGAAVGLLLLLRGLGIELLLLAGVYDGNPAVTPGQRHWSLVLWNPWFALGGAAFLLATSGARRAPALRPRRRSVRGPA